MPHTFPHHQGSTPEEDIPGPTNARRFGETPHQCRAQRGPAGLPTYSRHNSKRFGNIKENESEPVSFQALTTADTTFVPFFERTAVYLESVSMPERPVPGREELLHLILAHAVRQVPHVARQRHVVAVPEVRGQRRDRDRSRRREGTGVGGEGGSKEA